MSWEDEQDGLTLEARLSHSSPEIVYEQLKKIGLGASLFGNKVDTLEMTLIERNEPIINLGLATFGLNKDVFKALYDHSREPAKTEADRKYKQGIRIGCLSNRSIVKSILFLDFPLEIIGAEELQRLCCEADYTELKALICNPKVSDRLLEELYKRAGPFAALADDRWASIVSLSSKNERLNTKEDTEDMPDLGHYWIHKAIFHLLEIAPVEPKWMWCLYDLLESLNPNQVAYPERLDNVLSRWKALSISNHKHEPVEGHYTSLPISEEFRCMIGALYGRGYADKQSALFGSVNSPDVAYRCAYYGRANLSIKDMKAGDERAKSAYVFAALFNSDVVFKRELRALFEEEQLGGKPLSSKYLRNIEFLKKRWPDLQAPTSEFLKEEAGEQWRDSKDASLERIENSIATLQKKIVWIENQLRSFWSVAIAVGIVLAIVYFVRLIK